MPRTPDEFPGFRIEESIQFESGSVLPFPSGLINYATGTISGSGFFFNEEEQVVGPLRSLLNSSSHERLRQLVHLSNDDGPRGAEWQNNLVNDSGPFPFPTSSIWYTDSSRTVKIVEQSITRNGMKLPTSIQWKAYSNDGITVVESYTDTITYNGIFEVSRVRSQP